ncbi:hypothetical protein [Streptomyces sp. NPDC093261]|uniref:hypothetical protein n=1 Tax=Streptomyces sp. NPDC093261 TaxID=3366037 RepID=UPI0038084A4E
MMLGEGEKHATGHAAPHPRGRLGPVGNEALTSRAPSGRRAEAMAAALKAAFAAEAA